MFLSLQADCENGRERCSLHLLLASLAGQLKTSVLASVLLKKEDFAPFALSNPCSDKPHNYRSKIIIVDLCSESLTNFNKHDSGERGEWYSKYRL